MTDAIAQKLNELNITLPEAAAPAAAYLPFTKSGNLLYISGQLPFADGTLFAKGLLGDHVSLEDGQKAAEYCAINILSVAKLALDGDLSRIKQIVKINGFVASTPDFVSQHLVINGASELLAKILGDQGQHARAAVGMASLPLNAAVEIEAIIEFG